MGWSVVFDDAFDGEFQTYPDDVQDKILALAQLLERFGPGLKRPHCDTLNGSRHANMKELRCNAGGGAWRVAFAFDPERKAILLVGGDKTGGSQKQFYRTLIRTADERFDAHLSTLKRGKGGR